MVPSCKRQGASCGCVFGALPLQQLVLPKNALPDHEGMLTLELADHLHAVSSNAELHTQAGGCLEMAWFAHHRMSPVCGCCRHRVRARDL